LSSIGFEQHRAQTRQIVERHRAGNARVLGSVLRREDSDLDLLVEPDEHKTLLDLGAIQYEVSQLLGIGVNVLTPGALPEKWRDRVLREAQRV